MASDNGPDITLYRLHGCPYCERVVRRLEDLEVPFESKFVPGEHSRRNAVKRVSGGRAVPVVIDRNMGVTMAESANIVDYLDRTYGEA